MPTPVPVFSRTSERIETIDDWKLLASTKGKWADGYSAKELARLWLSGRGPAAVYAALEPVLPGLTFNRAVAEAQISFDSYEGGVRNHDVLAYGSTSLGDVVVGIEGKVNEALDAPLAKKYEQARTRIKRGQNTNLHKRVDDLLETIAGTSLSTNPELAHLHYQLFSAIAGTAAAATSTTVAAAVVVHLINSPLAKPEKFAATRTAVAKFCATLGIDDTSDVVGPIRLKKALGDAPLGMPIWLTIIETGTA